MSMAAVVSTVAVSGEAVDVAPPSDSVSRSEILELLKERRDAFYQGDIDKFGKFETEDFTRISEDGGLVTKMQQLAYLRARVNTRKAAKPIAYVDDELSLAVLGHIAVLTGRLSETEPTEGGGPRTERSRFTEVWVFRDGRWQTLHNHYTNVPP